MHAVLEQELAHVLDHYALGRLLAAQRTEFGFVNDNWIVETDQGHFFLKRRHPCLRKPDLIRAQHELMRWLRQAGFPAPTVVPTAAGESFLTLGEDLYEIEDYIEGEPYDHDLPVHLESAAMTLGYYHTYVEGFSRPALRAQGKLYSPVKLQKILARLREAWQLDRDARLVPLTRHLEAQVQELEGHFVKQGSLPHLVIHGDYYAGNLLFEGDRIVGVVDYDKANWQPRVAELAEALIYFGSPRPGHLKYLVYPGFLEWEPFTRFLQSYARVVVLEENEIQALPDYVRCIWVSVSLCRLWERFARCPAEALEILQEVLVLVDWASASAYQMVEIARAAMYR